MDALRIVRLPLDSGVSSVAMGNPNGLYSISGQSDGNCESRVAVRFEKSLRLYGGSFSNER
jgi:hypothetical protein